MFKKGISPIIAISLLIVVSIIAVIGYQNWYTGYQSTLFSDTQIKSNNKVGKINIEYISGEGILYILNKNNENQTINTIKLGEIDCNINQELKPGINNISIGSCLNETGINNLIIITDQGIIQEKIFIDNINIPILSSLSFSSNITNIAYDTSINLSWNSQNLDSCTASDDWSGSKGLDGSIIISNIRTNNSYTLNCTGIYGNLSQTINVDIISYPSCGNITTGLYGLWHFDNNANDYSGYTRHASLLNGLTYSSGQIGSALSFDGVNDYAQIPTTNMDSDSWSISWWMKRDENGYDTLFWGGQGLSGALAVDGHDWAGYAANNFCFESNSNNLYNIRYLVSDKPTSDGNWRHYAFVFNSTGSYLFQDGVMDSTTFARNHDTSAWPLIYIGRGQGTGSPYGTYFKGYLDEISLWNRPLSSTEILDLYDYGSVRIPICNP